ncbi:carbon-nitrogen hydrolase family protein [Natronolimnohabitans sp. A-GB9]|uniref:carbon-nitrogen hydrolase family protein n=1 Tax=Natronolimnohabitans sp. A-GB9 TaxID=3069757 RepID=UPI0027B7654D|nr:carbon-nitrogen hydrolase family protein [Natronolimnohabitans sp. A-GB9]MDQ2052228.1 carbon-nitrogen hydrolase family protein [Natronolimnohabitans sp. A-GB9]
MTEQFAACQFEPTIGDVDANLETIRAVGEDLPAAVTFAVFPELCVTGYDLPVVPYLGEPIPGPTTDSLVDIAAELDCQLAVGLPERDGNRYFNTTVVVSEHGVEATYRKRYLWGDETNVFEPGDGPTTVETPLGRVGLCCCYELNFPEVGLEYARRSCDALAVNAAWRESFLDDWNLLCRARARDGPYYVVASNHTGDQDGREHAGHSLVATPQGEIETSVGTEPDAASAPVTEAALERARKRNPVRRTRIARGEWQ